MSMAGSKKYRRDGEVSYALGITLTFELLQHKREYVNRVYIHSLWKEGEAKQRLLSFCRKEDIEVIESDKIFHVLTQKENCFCIGEFQKFAGKLEQDKSHLVLVNPSNAGNLGTIMRSSLGFALNQIAIIRPGVDAFDPKTVRASMGAIFATEIEYFDTYEDYEARFSSNRELYPFMLQAKIRLQDIAPQGIFSLIFGNEATGLPSSFLEVGTSVIIPHSQQIDSLNLPIAASIAMFEATKHISLR